MNSIHGHEILNYIIEHEPSYHELKQYSMETFGKEARFHTCSSQNMSIDELIAFLELRGKFIVSGDKMVGDPVKMCAHHD